MLHLFYLSFSVKSSSRQSHITDFVTRKTGPYEEPVNVGLLVLCDIANPIPS